MKRSLVLAVLSLFAIPGVAQARAEFDPKIAALRLPGDALRTYDFETPESLVGAAITTWVDNGQFPSLGLSPIKEAKDVAPFLSGQEDAVEGAHGLKLGSNGTGFAITDATLFSQIAKGKFEVSLWSRIDGGSVQLQVIYDKNPQALFADATPFATVRAVRTGRATTDGWAEYSTGPLDGSVWGTPVAAVLIAASPFAEADAAFVVDALEVRSVPGTPTEPLACTQQNVEAVCGASGDCIYGHCVSSTVTWGILPSLSQRRELAERWVFLATRFIGDRKAMQIGSTFLTPNARLLAENAISSRQFFGGLNRLVNLLRDNHTSFGSPTNFSQFAPQVGFGSSSVLGACFGVVDKDLLGGGLGYAVFQTVPKPLSKKPLVAGDVLYSIDGREPKEWVDDVWPRFATTLPNDPSSDWSPSANDLSRLIATRASTVTLLRCASSSACGPGQRQEIVVDVASAVYKALTVGFPDDTSPSVGCTQRFSDSVAGIGGGGGQFGGEDAVAKVVGPVGETRVQFDGFMGEDAWTAAMASVFDPSPAKVIMDARMGHGGLYSAVEALFNLVRGTSEPTGVLSIGRGSYDLADPPWLMSRLGVCANDGANGSNDIFWTCFQGNTNGFFATQANPPGASSKIAWLNASDVSANDFMPRLLKGRSKVRIFAPHPTTGAFGSIASLPGIWTGWSGGSMQVQDTRFAPDLASLVNAQWESSHGVVPDAVVAQKLSDTLKGEDTMLAAATAWLQAP